LATVDSLTWGGCNQRSNKRFENGIAFANPLGEFDQFADELFHRQFRSSLPGLLQSIPNHDIRDVQTGSPKILDDGSRFCDPTNPSSKSIRPILVRRISGDALTMRSIGTFHLVLQFLGSHLAGGDLGMAERLDEVPSAHTGDLSPFSLRNKTTAVQMDRRRKPDLPVDFLWARSEIFEERV
jgi:hypothetical protein